MTARTHHRLAFLKPLALLGVLAALLAVAGEAQPAHAAVFTVTKTADTNDGVCDADCSLREAIGAANALSGADTITVPAGTYTLSIGGAGEDLNATGDLDIIDHLTISGAGAASTIVDGGALDRVLHVDPNLAGVTVEISGLTIQNGSAQGGGGIFVDIDGTLTLNSSSVSGNSAGPGSGTAGGGIENFGTLTLNSSTVSGNSAGVSAGGIWNDGTMTLNNSTVSGNTAGTNTGGIFHMAGTLTLNSSTVSGNISPYNGAGIWNSGGTALKNTIVANNIGSGDCDGNTPTSNGYNLDSDGTCGLTGVGDISSTDPLLGALTDNGGPTETHALLTGSPAIDAGSPDCPPPFVDQRGVTRPQGTVCDIGAYEFEGGPPPSDGDVTCDGLVNVVDGLFILQFEVGLRVDSGGCPLPPPPPDTLNVAACDVNDDGLCNVVDALFILQCEVGIPNVLCPP